MSELLDAINRLAEPMKAATLAVQGFWMVHPAVFWRIKHPLPLPKNSKRCRHRMRARRRLGEQV